jgi:hypothetical protein
MSDLVIDEDGQPWEIDDPDLQQRLSTTLRRETLKKYVIVNLGWIGVRTTRAAFHVRCRPSLVTDAAVGALLFEVHERPDASIMLEFLREAWCSTLIRDRRMFVSYLASIIAGERQSSCPPDSRLLHRLTDRSASPFKAGLAEAVREAGESMSDMSNAKRVFDWLFNGRWALHTLDTERGHSIIEDLGNRYTPFNPKWLATAHGQSLCAYGDEAYGLWIADLQRSASESGDATFDDVDAIVAFPGIGDTRLRYSRMTVPMRRPDGRRFLLSAAVSNSRINLRQGRGQDAG